jgi:hypothetical protein
MNIDSTVQVYDNIKIMSESNPKSSQKLVRVLSIDD